MLTKRLSDLHHRRIHLPRTLRVAEALADLLAPRAPRRLLDVGTGDGRIGRGVADRLGAAIEGIDTIARPGARVPTRSYAGEGLPFDDGAFDAVLLSDVLHHAASPEALLRECLRVARLVAIKDHFAFGPWSRAVLRVMDAVGNHQVPLSVSGYLSPPAWVALVTGVGAKLSDLRWPLTIHDLPFRLVTRSELQFAALVEGA